MASTLTPVNRIVLEVRQTEAEREQKGIGGARRWVPGSRRCRESLTEFQMLRTVESRVTEGTPPPGGFLLELVKSRIVCPTKHRVSSFKP